MFTDDDKSGNVDLYWCCNWSPCDHHYHCWCRLLGKKTQVGSSLVKFFAYICDNINECPKIKKKDNLHSNAILKKLENQKAC